jgi:hypothetical protein
MDLCDLFRTVGINKKTPSEIFVNLFKNEILLQSYESNEVCFEKIDLLKQIYNHSITNDFNIDIKYNIFVQLFQDCILEGEHISTIYDNQVNIVKKIFYQSLQ